MGLLGKMGYYVALWTVLTLWQVSDSSRWHEWWTYDAGISGPNYWGLLNQGWSLCKKGHNQSPVNIDPKALLFDPSLSPLEISGNVITGVLTNKGHSLTLDVELKSHWSRGVNISGGPLSYNFRVSQLRAHFSHSDTDGSEHTVEGRGFSAEIHIFAYNSDLYHNMTSAMTSPRGVLCVAVFLKVSNATNPHFERIHKALDDVLYKGDQREISYLELRGLLPQTDHYMTYEGSLTHPACHETVTWVIYNKPVYISHTQIAGLRSLKQDTKSNPVLLMAGNIRPVQPLNQRTIRTNINLAEGACSMTRDINYAELRLSMNVPYRGDKEKGAENTQGSDFRPSSGLNRQPNAKFKNLCSFVCEHMIPSAFKHHQY